MASEQIAALTKTLTESLIAQQKAKIDFQKQMLVQQERFETLVIQQTADNRLFCETVLSQKCNDSASRFFSAEDITNSLAEFKYDPERGDTFPAYYRWFEAIFTKRCEKWSDEEKNHTPTLEIGYGGKYKIYKFDFTKETRRYFFFGNWWNFVLDIWWKRQPFSYKI